MVMLELSPTYRQLCALSAEKLMDTAVPGIVVLVCSLINCSATKPHLPGSPVGLLHALPEVRTVLVEHLNAIVAAVADVNLAVVG
jgi:hypothetical protein